MYDVIEGFQPCMTLLRAFNRYVTLCQVFSLTLLSGPRQVCSLTLFAAALLTIVILLSSTAVVSEIYTVGLEKLFVEVTLAV